MNYTIRKNCRICHNANNDAPLTQKFLSLGSTPLADRFLDSPTDPKESFPLDLYVCKQCQLVQLVDIVDDKLLFGDDYAFFTGGSPSSISYFKDYADEMIQRFPEQARYTVEIASNDGTLLKHFRDASGIGRMQVLGIEPAKTVADYANAQGVTTVQEYLSYQTARDVKRWFSTAGLIIANNVVAHVDNLYDFMAGVDCLLDEKGVFVFEVQYFPHLLDKNAFDHVYHEHRSFFSLRPLLKLLEISGFRAFDVKTADAQGGSIRIYADKKHREALPSVQKLIDEEIARGLDKMETYQGFQERVDSIKAGLVSMLKGLKAQGKTVYGFGASAKGNTLLNYCEIGPDLLDCVVDLTPYKIGKYTPGSHIVVKSPSQLKKQPDYYLVQVWNYLGGILERETAFRKAGGKFIVPIPSPTIL